jgi:ubiquinone/menaquinone biosynthesis C-methylase UbiE
MSSNEVVDEPWNTVLFDTFVRLTHLLVTGLARYSDELLLRNLYPVGVRVLDVGCGFGDSTLTGDQYVRPSFSLSRDVLRPPA